MVICTLYLLMGIKSESIRLLASTVVSRRYIYFRPRTLVSVDARVVSISWSPDSTRLLYRIQQRPSLEEYTFQERIVSIDAFHSASVDNRIAAEHTREPLGPTIWSSRNDMFYVQNYEPNALSSFALWGIAPNSRTDSPSSSSSASSYFPPRRIGYGEQCDVEVLFDLGTNEIAVSIAQGLDTQIHVLSESEARSWRRFVAFTTYQDAFHHHQHQRRRRHQQQQQEQYYNSPAVDMKRRPSDGTYVLATVRSSSVRQEPPEVWAGFTRPGEHGTVDICLSAHHEAWLVNRELPATEAFMWRGRDGGELQGVISYPYHYSSLENAGLLMRLPTIVVPHDETIGCVVLCYP
jgi:dipeptidyl aminopeptidase/acylaminoacyl peptidase